MYHRTSRLLSLERSPYDTMHYHSFRIFQTHIRRHRKHHPASKRKHERGLESRIRFQTTKPCGAILTPYKLPHEMRVIARKLLDVYVHSTMKLQLQLPILRDVIQGMPWSSPKFGIKLCLIHGAEARGTFVSRLQNSAIGFMMLTSS